MQDLEDTMQDLQVIQHSLEKVLECPVEALENFMDTLKVTNRSAYEAAQYNTRMQVEKEKYFSIRAFQLETNQLVHELQRRIDNGEPIEDVEEVILEKRTELCQKFQQSHVDVDEDHKQGGLWLLKLSTMNGWTRPTISRISR